MCNFRIVYGFSIKLNKLTTSKSLCKPIIVTMDIVQLLRVGYLLRIEIILLTTMDSF